MTLLAALGLRIKCIEIAFQVEYTHCPEPKTAAAFDRYFDSSVRGSNSDPEGNISVPLAGARLAAAINFRTRVAFFCSVNEKPQKKWVSVLRKHKRSSTK